MSNSKQQYLICSSQLFLQHNICLYCHQQHAQNATCPKMKQISALKTKAIAQICPLCSGKGSYQRIKTIIFQQTPQNHAKQLTKWKINATSTPIIDIDNNPVPVLRTLKQLAIQQEVKCRACTEGLIFKYIRCQVCSGTGCSACNSGLRISHRWLKTKFDHTISKEGIVNTVDLTIDYCCRCDEQCENEVTFERCCHVYHQKCLPEWLVICPKCKEVQYCKREDYDSFLNMPEGSEECFSLSHCWSSPSCSLDSSSSINY